MKVTYRFTIDCVVSSRGYGIGWGVVGKDDKAKTSRLSGLGVNLDQGVPDLAELCEVGAEGVRRRVPRQT